jgi:prepilin-type N-terminal cleavage/methylation domain-containing protein
MLNKKTMKGFTLIEILVVVALIAILTAITFIAINPAKNFADTRNAQRSSDVVQILNAITQYTSEQNNTLSSLIALKPSNTAIPTCNASTDPAVYVPLMAFIGTSAGNVNLTGLVDAYIVGIPYDPSTGVSDGTNTAYKICQTAGGRVQINAPGAEGVGKLITVKR